MNTYIVLGAGWGDEGKGHITSFLCKEAQKRQKFQEEKSPLVIRFSGGHQCGHTVTLGNKRHVFQSFGSGSLNGVPTYWSKYCTIYPWGLANEYHGLLSKAVIPRLYVDGLAMVTTYHDVFYNQALEKLNGHGSVGVGFGTIERNLGPHKLYAQDLMHERILSKKLDSVKMYYDQLVSKNDKLKALYAAHDFTAARADYLKAVERCRTFIKIKNEVTFNFGEYSDIIFEGNQGILLDQDFGFYPNVTWAYTTSRNAMEMITRLNLPKPDVFYVTRAYQTRHGNGFMTNEGTLQPDNKNETNQHNEWQGNFRIGLLDLDLLNYAIACDSNYSTGTKNLALTCIDQIDGKIMATFSGRQVELTDDKHLLSYINADMRTLLKSSSEKVENIEWIDLTSEKKFVVGTDNADKWVIMTALTKHRTNREAAKAMGISVSLLQKRMRHHGIKKNRCHAWNDIDGVDMPGTFEDVEKKFLEDLLQKYGSKRNKKGLIAFEFGCSVSTLRSKLVKYNLLEHVKAQDE